MKKNVIYFKFNLLIKKIIIGNCSSDEAQISSTHKLETIQLCSNCSCASVALKSPTSNENFRKESSTYTNVLISNSSTCLPNVTTCRCGSKRRGSSVGSQMFEEAELEKHFLIERLNLINQNALVKLYFNYFNFIKLFLGETISKIKQLWHEHIF